MMDSYPSRTIILKKLFYKLPSSWHFTVAIGRQLRQRKRKQGVCTLQGRNEMARLPHCRVLSFWREEGGLKETFVVYRIVYQTVEILPKPQSLMKFAWQVLRLAGDRFLLDFFYHPFFGNENVCKCHLLPMPPYAIEHWHHRSKVDPAQSLSRTYSGWFRW